MAAEKLISEIASGAFPASDISICTLVAWQLVLQAVPFRAWHMFVPEAFYCGVTSLMPSPPSGREAALSLTTAVVFCGVAVWWKQNFVLKQRRSYFTLKFSLSSLDLSRHLDPLRATLRGVG